MPNFIFIGNEKDRKTKEWGIKNGGVYRLIWTIQDPVRGRMTAYIKTGEKTFAECPYETLEAFMRNWKPV